MENKTSQINNKYLYFVSIFSILIVLISLLFLIPKENWKCFFSNNFNNTATVFQINATWTGSSSGNWASSTTWGIHVPNPLSYPTAIALDSNNNIYIANNSNYPVIILNSDGTASTTYGGIGSPLHNTLYSPLDIEIGASGNIYIVTGGGRLVLSDPGFNNTQTINVNSYSISLSKNEEIYDGTFESSTINILNSDGTASSSFIMASGTPNKISVSPVTGKIYIIPLEADRISVYNPDGSFLTDYPIHCTNIYISNDDQIYAIDYINSGSSRSSTIKVYNPDGSASTSAPVYYPGYGNHAAALTISDDNKLYVVNSGSNTVIIFNPDGTIYATYDGLTPDPSFIPVEGIDYPGINDTVILGQGTINLTENQSIENLTLVAGATLNLNGYTLTIGHDGNYLNTGGTLITGGGNVMYLDDFTSVTSGPWNATSTWGITSTTSIEGIDFPGIDSNVIINTGIVTLSENQAVRNITFDAGGTLNLNGYTLDVGGNWTNTGGVMTLNPGNEGTVNLISASTQSIIGDNTFENLTKISPLTSALHFDTDSNTIITHDITFSGSSDRNLLSVSPTGFIPPQFDGYFNNQSGYVGSGDEQIAGPYDIAFDSQNNMYVIDSTRHAQKFDSNGNFITKFAPNGNSCDGCVKTEIDGFVAIDDLDNIYIPSTFSQHSTGRIVVFASTTATSSIIGSFANPAGDGQFYTIRGIAINPFSGDIYVTESNRVEVFNPNGTYKTQFGSYGSGDGQFWLPKSIAFNSNGDIYVQDASNSRIQIFSSDFTYKGQFGSEGTESGQFKNMYHGMVIDSSNNIYVVDRGNSRVQIFNPDGTYKGQFGSYGSGDGQFNRPYGIAIDNNGVIYIADTLNSRIVKYSYATIPQFNITQQTDSGGINNFSYLSVSGSINLSTSSFYCTSCADGGGNVNWTIPRNARRHPIEVISTTTLSTPVSISISPIYSTIMVGSTTTFTSIALDQFGVVLSTTTNWINLNNSIGTIDTDGIFTAISAGTSTVTASVGILSISTNITVINKPVASSTKLEEEKTEPEPEIKPKPKKRPSVILPVETITIATTTDISTTTPSTLVAIVNTTSTKNIIENIGDSIVAGYQNSIITPADVQAVKDIVTSPVGDAVTKTISTVGAVAGAGISVSTIAFANPIVFTDLWLIPARLFGLLMGALGIKRKQRQWGTVYDSVTKRPLDPAYVSLISTETGKEVTGAITDIDGRYGFLVLPGKYRIEAKKTNYIQPSVKMKGRAFDEVYNDLYFGEEMLVTEEGQIITKNIPMDSLSFDWNEFAKTKMNVNTFLKSRDITWAKISKILFAIGAIVSFIAVIFAPAPYNLIIVIFYILAYIFNFIVLKNKKPGTLVEKNTNIPLSFAIVSIFREGEDTPLTKKIADKFGDYYALVPNGKYSIKVEKKKDDGTYTEVFMTEVIDIETGVINMNFVV